MRLGIRLGLDLRRRGQGDLGVTPILDGISGAGIVLSLDRLRTAYSGTVVTIRRVSPAAEEEFSYDALGRLDQAAILAFVGASTGYYAQWWDASGNARHFSQSTAENQPLAVSGGVFYPPTFDGVNDVMTGNAASLNVLQNVPGAHAFTIHSEQQNSIAETVLFVSTNISSIFTRYLVSKTATNLNRIGVRRLDADSFTESSGVNQGAGLHQRTSRVNYASGGDGAISGRLDGVAALSGALAGSGNTSNTASLHCEIGGVDGSQLLQGVIKEVILFPSILSDANRNAIESSQIARR
jgi:hypothetical protein